MQRKHKKNEFLKIVSSRSNFKQKICMNLILNHSNLKPSKDKTKIIIIEKLRLISNF